MEEFVNLCPKYPTSNKYEKNLIPKRLYKIPKNRAVRIYVDGIYDLFHFGHMLNFKQAKELFPNVYLLVGICNDDLTHKYKGKTVNTYEERLENIRHCKYVDEIVENAPWSINKEYIEKYEIDYVAHDDAPYIWNKGQKYKNKDCETDQSTSEEIVDNKSVVDPEDVYFYVKSNDLFIPTVRAACISTSGIITRIVKDYDEFVRRNLERGISAKELNIGIIDENIYKVKNKMQYEYNTARDEIKIVLKFWEDKSKEFLNMYEKNVLQKIRDAFNKDEKDQSKIVRACKKMVDKVKKRKKDGNNTKA